jgi:hypothetical protein
LEHKQSLSLNMHMFLESTEILSCIYDQTGWFGDETSRINKKSRERVFHYITISLYTINQEIF